MPDPALQDACELLDADHLAVKHLFVEYFQISIGPNVLGAKQRLSIARKICDELTIHAQIEEEGFYPALRSAVPDVGAIVDEAVEQHLEARELVAQIRGLQEANEATDSLMAQLNWMIEQHVKEERDQLFPMARGAQALDLQALAVTLRKLQQEFEAQPEQEADAVLRRR